MSDDGKAKQKYRNHSWQAMNHDANVWDTRAADRFEGMFGVLWHCPNHFTVSVRLSNLDGKISAGSILTYIISECLQRFIFLFFSHLSIVQSSF